METKMTSASTSTSPRFIVMTSSAHVSGKARQFGRYANVAVVQLEEDFSGVPTMISERAKGVLRVVRHWGACRVGKTDRCEFAVAKRDAEAMAAKLNNRWSRYGAGPTA